MPELIRGNTAFGIRAPDLASAAIESWWLGFDVSGRGRLHAIQTDVLLRESVLAETVRQMPDTGYVEGECAYY